MFRLPTFVLALSLAVMACGGDSPPKPPDLAEVLPNVPLPPDASFVSRAGGTDALQITLKSPSGPADVAEYYRAVFKRPPWRLVNDAKDQQGGVVFFAEQNGPPIWVRVRAGEGGGSLVDIAGARVSKSTDSSKAQGAPPAAAKPTS